MIKRPKSDVESNPSRSAEATPRSTAFPAALSDRDSVVPNDRWALEIRNALAEADRGEFADDDLVREVLGKWGVDAGQGTCDGARQSGRRS